MSDTGSTDGRTTEIEWVRLAHANVPDPIVRRIPYVELKLEHPGLDSTRFGESFFPDAVPYVLDDEHRVFYWRPTLPTETSDPSLWEGVCATTDALSIVTAAESHSLDFVTQQADATEVVVDGTIAGDSTTALVGSYVDPDVRIRELSESRLELQVDGTTYVVPPETRRRISLSEQTVERVDGDGESASVTPELVIRFPGERELHHPACGSEYQLFPSFGLELDSVPSPLPVPTTNGELDYATLATSLDIDLSARPYPERVLWQAFAYTAFDPHADTVPHLSQFPTGHLALLTDPGSNSATMEK